MTIPDHLVIFDGVCNFCNSAVNFIIRNDRKAEFHFVPFQSDISKDILRSEKIPLHYFNSIIYVNKGKAYYKSTAVLKILKQLGGLYQLYYIFIIVPPFIRDFFYDRIAKNRYRLFGKREACMVPTPEVRNKFL
jgi:predicted DCC family thiol-disulfide oxidoreductase YuxK